MFGLFGGKKDNKPSKRSKEEERYIQRKEDEAVRSFFGSAKEESDRRAERGE